MLELNPDNPLVSALHNHWHTLMAILLHKLKLPEIVITSDDVAQFNAAHPDSAALLYEKPDGLYVMLITMEQAKQLALQEKKMAVSVKRLPHDKET